MRFLLGISDGFERTAVTIGKLGAWLSLPLIAVIIFDVITRKIYWTQQLILNSWAHEYMSSTKLQEWEFHLHTALFLLALGYAYSLNAHVRVDLVREKLPVKGQVWIELIGCVIFLIPYCLLVLWFAWDFVVQSYVSGEVSAAMTGLSHRWIIKSFILIGLVLSLMAGIAVMLRQIVYLTSPALRPEVKLHMLTAPDLEAVKAEVAEIVEHDPLHAKSKQRA